MSQRTLNVHLARGSLNNTITHPVFEDLDEVTRFRLWNGGQSAFFDYVRDPFMQKASKDLNVLYSDSRVAIKFINGEFWGFTQIREHTSNEFFVNSRAGVALGNIAIMDSNVPYNYHAGNFPLHANSQWTHEVEAGGNRARTLYNELIAFIEAHDLSTDYARERLFNEFFCQYNFMDYIIANLFFVNADWVINNIRYFRATVPVDDSNPYNDGRWRFIMHDLDWALLCLEGAGFDVMEWLLEARRWTLYGASFSKVFSVGNNPAFAISLRERALEILEKYFYSDRLVGLYTQFIGRVNPLIIHHYNRFPVIFATPNEAALENTRVLQALASRQVSFRQELDYFVTRLGICLDDLQI